MPAPCCAVVPANHLGDRALFLFPPGLDFIVAFFGCLAAGVIAVPLMVPRRTEARDSSAAIIADCAPKVAMTSRDLDGRPDVKEKFAARFRMDGRERQ